MQTQAGSRDTIHVPVLLHEVIQSLAITPEDHVIDCTLGGGGYAEAIIAALGARGRYVGIDADEGAVRRAGALASDTRVTLVTANFRDVRDVLKNVDGIRPTKVVADLGFSSDQLAAHGGVPRGFSFERDEPLLMTFKEEGALFSAADIVNTWSEETIADIVFGYGEERQARRIAKAIVEARSVQPIRTTGELVDVVSSVVPRRGRTHPATKTFQALRIAVNDELGSLEALLYALPSILSQTGRAVFVTFHSLEDRAVKQAFRAWKQASLGDVLTKRPVTPSDDERAHNPRSRSAKLRTFIFNTSKA